MANVTFVSGISEIGLKVFTNIFMYQEVCCIDVHLPPYIIYNQVEKTKVVVNENMKHFHYVSYRNG